MIERGNKHKWFFNYLCPESLSSIRVPIIKNCLNVAHNRTLKVSNAILYHFLRTLRHVSCLPIAKRIWHSNLGISLFLLGPIIYYILLRNGIECFQGTSLSFSDSKGIEPFQEYSYQLKACTVAGCAVSSKVRGSTQTPDRSSQCED